MRRCTLCRTSAYHPALDASIVLVQNSHKNAGKEPGINPLLRPISTILFPENPVNG